MYSGDFIFPQRGVECIKCSEQMEICSFCSLIALRLAPFLPGLSVGLPAGEKHGNVSPWFTGAH